jgi:hypothetical protein
MRLRAAVYTRNEGGNAQTLHRRTKPGQGFCPREEQAPKLRLSRSLMSGQRSARMTSLRATGSTISTIPCPDFLPPHAHEAEPGQLLHVSGDRAAIAPQFFSQRQDAQPLLRTV